MSERIIDFVHVRKGWHIMAVLVITDKRFIIAWTWRVNLLLTLFLMPALLALIVPIWKAAKLEKLPPDEILTADPHNAAIPFSDVVEVTTGGLLVTRNISIETRESKYRFNLTKAELHHFEDHVVPYLANKVPIR